MECKVIQLRPEGEMGLEEVKRIVLNRDIHRGNTLKSFYEAKRMLERMLDPNLYETLSEGEKFHAHEGKELAFAERIGRENLEKAHRGISTILDVDEKIYGNTQPKYAQAKIIMKAHQNKDGRNK